MVSHEKYVPGFDWVRLIGSILVVLTHFGFFEQAYAASPIRYRMFAVLVPVFFMMSGFLRKNHFSKKLVFKQVIKYWVIYLAIDYFTVLYTHYMLWRATGEFDFARVAGYLLKGLVCNYGHSIQLWFIPALIYPMLLNAFLNDKTRKIVIAVAAVLLVFSSSMGDERLSNWLNEMLSSFPAINGDITGQGLATRSRRALTGLLFTTVGFDIDTWKVKPEWLILAAVAFGIIEFSTCYLGVAAILLSILCFYLVKWLPGQFLCPYHMEISLFSCLMFFMHIFEKDLFHHITDSLPLNFFLILVFNLVITFAVSSLIRSKRQTVNI